MSTIGGFVADLLTAGARLGAAVLGSMGGVAAGSAAAAAHGEGERAAGDEGGGEG